MGRGSREGCDRGVATGRGVTSPHLGADPSTAKEWRPQPSNLQHDMLSYNSPSPFPSDMILQGQLHTYTYTQWSIIVINLTRTFSLFESSMTADTISEAMALGMRAETNSSKC